MEDFKVRMLDELKSLQEKIENLEKFICTDTKFKDLNFKHRASLRAQVFFMRQYAFWLSTRIGWWLTPEDLEEYNTPSTPVLIDEPVSEVVVEKKPKVKRRAKKNTKHE